jgi:hypothetical protein
MRSIDDFASQIRIALSFLTIWNHHVSYSVPFIRATSKPTSHKQAIACVAQACNMRLAAVRGLGSATSQDGICSRPAKAPLWMVTAGEHVLYPRLKPRRQGLKETADLNGHDLRPRYR